VLCETANQPFFNGKQIISFVAPSLLTIKRFELCNNRFRKNNLISFCPFFTARRSVLKPLSALQPQEVKIQISIAKKEGTYFKIDNRILFQLRLICQY
jgi:hypothetical protein